MGKTRLDIPLKFDVIAGGAAGAHTVTGISPGSGGDQPSNLGDALIAVLQLVGAGTDVTDIADLTSEFSISADDEIDNAGGTATTGDKLVVVWIDMTP